MSSMHRQVTIPARPESIAIDSARTAVVVVDMQNDFVSPGGMFDRAGIDVALVRKVISPIRSVLDAARRARMPIVYLKMEFSPDLSDVGPEDSPNRIKHRAFNVGGRIATAGGGKGRVLIKDTWNTQVIDELAPEFIRDGF